MAKRVAVIGGGVIGLSAAWALERRGFACLVFEHGAPGGGQSAGESRIFRHTHDDPRQFDLAVRARRGWGEWEDEFGVQLISSDGAMVLGEKGVDRLSRYADETGVEVRELGPDEVREALPVLAWFEGPALIDEAAGAIRTRLTLANLIGAVGLNLVPEQVEAVTPRTEGGVEVKTTLGSRVFDSVVVAAGPATARFAAEAGIHIPAAPRAHMRFTIPLVSRWPAQRLACVQDSSGAFGETTGYGSPVRGNREYTVGLALSADVNGSSSEPDPLDRISRSTTAYVRRAFPGLDQAAAVAFQRWSTELPWSSDGVAIWQRGDAFYIAGNNLFKLAPVLGRSLARAVVSGEVEPGLRPTDRLGQVQVPSEPS